MNPRDWKRIYNPQTGKIQYQHYTGGVFVNSLKEITPSIIKGGCTGKGHCPSKTVMHKALDVSKSVEQEAEDVGEAILKRLRIRSGKGIENNLESRIKKIIKGNGMQIV